MSVLTEIKRVEISHKPTKIHLLKNLSEKYGVEIYCMRDDLTGFSFGGNKTRKLDFLIADAISKGCDSIIGIGGQQSNFCRLAAAAAVNYSLEPFLVLRGEEPNNYTGNLELNRLIGANISFVGDRITKKEAWLLEQELIKKGRKPYRMPSGGSTEVGSLGYVEALEEIISFEKENGLEFSHLFHATGSGGTQCGLLVGSQLYDWNCEIIGVSVSSTAENLSRVIEVIGESTFKLLNKNLKIDTSKINIDVNYIGKKYGIPTEAGIAAIKEFLIKEGIALDYVYSGKAAAGMIDYIEKGKIDKSKPILFLHTGGNVQLFADPYPE